MPDLEIVGLVKELGGRRVVDDVTLTVREGEMMVVLGPSGCGKTTTMRLVTGLEAPDGGRVLLGGRDITDLPPRRRNLGMVFQEYGLYPTMTVHGNMAYGLEARGGVDRAEIDRRVRDAAARFDLTDKLDLPVTDLSGGEQQRVALGRATVKDADAYLYDEPLSNLDPKLRYRARRDILAAHRLKGRPSLYITHDQNEAFALADRVAVMSGGRIQQVGTPQELIDEPRNTFVAGFVGSPPMNLLRGTLKEEGGRSTVVLDGEEVALAGPVPGRSAGGEVVVGLRPHGLRLRTRDEPPVGAPGLAADVRHVEPLIGETVVELATPSGQPLTAVLDDLDAEGVTAGARVRVEVDPQAVRLFDATTGEALR